jgi:hypothetical protein
MPTEYPLAELARGMIAGPYKSGRAAERSLARATSRAVRKAQAPHKEIKGMSSKRARTVIGEAFYKAIAQDRIAKAIRAAT